MHIFSLMLACAQTFVYVHAHVNLMQKCRGCKRSYRSNASCFALPKTPSLSWSRSVHSWSTRTGLWPTSWLGASRARAVRGTQPTLERRRGRRRGPTRWMWRLQRQAPARKQGAFFSPVSVFACVCVLSFFLGYYVVQICR
jgi:hypothetical protein